VTFHASLEDGKMWATAGDGPKVALIAGRTPDNPTLFRSALKAGATHILLEKPGAPSVAELEKMAAEAKAAGVPVFMGFIKNISDYVEGALAAEQALAGAKEVRLVSRNDYTRETLGECFSRNSEGMLKNMAIHEIALATQFWGMRADNIADVKLDPEGTEMLTLGDFTDLSRVDMTLTSTAGKSVRICADRCSGDGCAAIVTDTAKGQEVYNKEMVHGARVAATAQRIKAHPDWFSYLLTQEPEYAKLKGVCAKHAIAGTSPPGVATIEIAIEALKLAEYLTPLIKSKLAPSPASNCSVV